MIDGEILKDELIDEDVDFDKCDNEGLLQIFEAGN